MALNLHHKKFAPSLYHFWWSSRTIWKIVDFTGARSDQGGQAESSYFFSSVRA